MLPHSFTGKSLSKSASRARLHEIIRKRSFGRGEITLASGRKSNFYFNLKPTMLDPEGAALLAELTYEALKEDNLDYIGGQLRKQRRSEEHTSELQSRRDIVCRLLLAKKIVGMLLI